MLTYVVRYPVVTEMNLEQYEDPYEILNIWMS